jgi:hypothetical protein
MDWSSLVSTLLTLSIAIGQYRYNQRENLYSPIGSSAYVWIVNPFNDSLEVIANAPKVDNAHRVIGIVPPCDSVILRLPYTDTKVYLTLGTLALGTVEPKRLGLYRVSH